MRQRWNLLDQGNAPMGQHEGGHTHQIYVIINWVHPIHHMLYGPNYDACTKVLSIKDKYLFPRKR